MIYTVGDSIISKINSVPFFDKSAGVVKTIRYKDKDNGKEKRFPASCNTNIVECQDGKYSDLCPDSSKKSVIYLEDNGIRFSGRDSNLLHWAASLRLICWLNIPLLGFDGCHYSTHAINAIIAALPVTPYNIPNTIQRLKITPAGQAPVNENPFSKYTYDETVNQFLMYPYDYFVLNLDVDFYVDTRCLPTASLQTPITCQ